MTKEELILEWKKEIKHHNLQIRNHKYTMTDIHKEDRIRLISRFINDLKNLSGETVKLRATCSAPSKYKMCPRKPNPDACHSCWFLNEQVE